MARRAWGWRGRGYDLAINFEGDIRSNVLLGLSGASSARRLRDGRRRADADRLRPVRSRHSHEVERVAPRRARLRSRRPVRRRPRRPGPRRRASRSPARRARGPRRCSPALADGRPVVVVHAGGGREIKQWNLDRFADVVNRLAASHAAADRALRRCRGSAAGRRGEGGPGPRRPVSGSRGPRGSRHARGRARKGEPADHGRHRARCTWPPRSTCPWSPCSDRQTPHGGARSRTRARVVRVSLAMQPVQPDPTSARALPRPRSRLPRRRQRRTRCTMPLWACSTAARRASTDGSPGPDG